MSSEPHKKKVEKNLEKFLHQVEAKELNNDSFVKIVNPQLEKINNPLENQLFYLCASLIQVENGIENHILSGGDQKRSVSPHSKGKDALHELKYIQHLTRHLEYLFQQGPNVTIENKADIMVVDQDVIIGVMASDSMRQEEKHIQDLLRVKAKYRWFVNCITVDDVAIDVTIPKANLNILYFVHTLQFDIKRFICNYVGDDFMFDVTIDSSRKRKREEVIRQQVRERLAEEIALQLIKGEKSDECIMDVTGLTKKTLQMLRKCPSKK